LTRAILFTKEETGIAEGNVTTSAGIPRAPR
jgi:hypothetical protein